MSINQQVSRPIESPEIAQMLDRLVKEFGFVDPQAAMKFALSNLIGDLELPDENNEDSIAELREALADIDNGDQGQPLDEVCEEIRREFKS